MEWLVSIWMVTIIFILSQCSAEVSNRIAIITPPGFPDSRLAAATESLFSRLISSTAESRPELVWIRSDGDALSTTGELTRAYSKHRFAAIITSASHCQTALELSAAWRLTAMSFNCSMAEIPKLRQDASNLYWTHIKLDRSTFSMIPYIKLMYRSESSLTRITTVNSQKLPLIEQMSAELRADNFNIQWCISNCTQDLKQDEDMIVYGDMSEVESWLHANNQHLYMWRRILIVSEERVNTDKLSNWLSRSPQTSDALNNKSIYIIQPEQPSLQQNNISSIISIFTSALHLLLNAGFNEQKSTTQVVSSINNKCHTVSDRKTICFDRFGWSYGEFGLWKFNAQCENNGYFLNTNSFTQISKFVQREDNWILEGINCHLPSSTISVDISIKKTAWKMTANTILIVACVVLVLLLVLTIIVFKCKLKRSLTNRLTGDPDRETWRIDYNDIVPFREENQTSTDDNDSEMFTDSQKINAMCSKVEDSATDFGHYKEQPVSFKVVSKNTAIIVTRSQHKELSAMMELRHENVATFLGASAQSPVLVLVEEFCIKGSIQDLLIYETAVHLDEILISSLVQDVTRGLLYIHNSKLGYHGNLKSTNCLITARWAVRLSDFGLFNLRRANKAQDALLWCPPELLNLDADSLPSQDALQKMDIYSFGILLYELIGKQGPFGNGYQFESVKLEEMTSDIATKQVHPDTSILCCEDYIKNCMLSCWLSPPKSRPNFEQLRNKLKPFHSMLNGCGIVDNMLTMMERYQMRLEELVEERSSQLLAEKKKTETLLHRMLPPTVAAQLLGGGSVKPENYDCISVFFSDLCGFVDLASNKAPHEVISVLNSLYTVFDRVVINYDVYKVETVGDAYLCVSGLPKPNGDAHAAELARMALHFLSALQNFNKNQRRKLKSKVVSGSELYEVEEEGETLRMRIGIHSGPCVAGVVGVSMPRYTLFGDTVNVASRLETTGEPMKIQISDQTKILLDKSGGFTVTSRGMVHLKGKGPTQTYWLDQPKQITPDNHEVNLLPPNDMTLFSSNNNSFQQLLTAPDGNLLLRRSVSCKSSSTNSSSRPPAHLSIFRKIGSFRNRIRNASLSRENLQPLSTTRPPLHSKRGVIFQLYTSQKPTLNHHYSPRTRYNFKQDILTRHASPAQTRSVKVFTWIYQMNNMRYGE